MCKPNKIEKNYCCVEYPDGHKAVLGEIALQKLPSIPCDVGNYDISFADCENEFGIALKIIIKHLSADQDPGSIFFVWQSGLACLLKDNTDLNMEQCNELAIKWLKRLIS